MTVELYYFQPLGTNSGRVYLTLLEKGVPFVEHELSGRDFDHLRPEYLKVNPRGQAPALVHDGHALYEGMPINEYIDESFEGPPLRPADLRERWRMRVWCRYTENDLGRALMMINWNRVVPNFMGGRSMEEVEKVLETVPDVDRRRSWLAAFKQQTPPEAIEESHRRARAGVQKLEAACRERPYLAGQTYSLADIDCFNFCGFMAMWMPEIMNDKDTPAAMEWHRKISDRPAVKEMRSRTPQMQPPAGAGSGGAADASARPPAQASA